MLKLSQHHRILAAQFLKFAVVGALGFGVDLSLLYFAADRLGLSKIAAGFFSFPFAVTATWLGNKYLTFRDAAPMPIARQFAKFVAVCVIGLIFNRGAYVLLVSFVPVVAAHPYLGVIAGSGAGLFFNFFAARKHAFGLGGKGA